jgi:opacity protein-like surface antigen
MRKFLLVTGLLMLFSMSAVAQEEAPRFELYGMYTYSQIDDQEIGVDINTNGATFGVEFNTNNWFGLAAEFGFGVDDVDLGGGLDADVDQWTLLFGPRFHARTERFSPFAHVLFGFAHAGFESGGISEDETAFAMAIGAGADLNFNKNVAWRMISADYLMTRFDAPSPDRASRQDNVRISTGVVFRW